MFLFFQQCVEKHLVNVKKRKTEKHYRVAYTMKKKTKDTSYSTSK